MGTSPEADDRWFFVHLQKTGGTALFRRLRNTFPREAIYPDDSDGDPVAVAPQLDVGVLLDRWATRRDQVRIVTGHFPLCTAELLAQASGGVDRFRTLTVLREPVERTLSYLRHHRALTPADRDLPLEAIYEDDFRFHGLIHDHMVKMLALRTEEMTDGALTRLDGTEIHLQRAIDNLEGIEVVGIQERFEDFCAEAEARFGWDLGPPQFANRTKPVEVSDAFRARIAADNALDVELYRAAIDLVDRRAATGG